MFRRNPWYSGILRWVCTGALGLSSLADAASVKPVFTDTVKVSGPYTPGVVVGDYLYVSGQSAGGAPGDVDGDNATNPVRQLRACLGKIKSIAAAAGVPLEGIVYAQVYVADTAAFSAVESAWTSYWKGFKQGGPARSMIGVAKLPGDSPLVVSAVLVRDPAMKKAVFLEGAGAVPDVVLTSDRAFLSDCQGKVEDDPDTEVEGALLRMGVVLQAAGLDYRDLVFVNPYLAGQMGSDMMNRAYAKRFEFGNTPARATISVQALPHNARVEFTGVAVRDLAQRSVVRPKNMAPSSTASPCVFAAETFYCSAKSGFIPGPHLGIYASTVEGQVRQTMRNLLDGLEEAGLSFENVVAANLYVDDMQDAPRINAVYKQYFGAILPTLTTLQQHAPTERKTKDGEHKDGEMWPPLEQISLVAVSGVQHFELKAESPKFWDLIAPDTPIEIIATGFGFTEGPVWDARGYLYVSDEVTNKIVRLYPDGQYDRVAGLGDPDGNTYDRQHRLIDCASVLRAIIAVGPEGQYKVLADRYEGKRLNSPNDVVLGPDDALYFTDPTLDLVKGERQELAFQGVFRLAQDGAVRLLIKDLAQPNGLAFSPDGHRLYVDDSERKDIHAYDVLPSGDVSNGRLFAKMDPDGDPDGMRVDTAGNLYVTGAGGIWVFDPAGNHLGTVLLPEQTANLTWGDADYKTLYITSSTSVLKLRTRATGFVPYR